MVSRRKGDLQRKEGGAWGETPPCSPGLQGPLGLLGRHEDEGSPGAQADRLGDVSYRHILHTHTHARAHTRRTHTRAHMSTHVAHTVHTRMHAHTSTHAHTCMHTHAHTCTRTHVHTRAHTCTRTHEHAHTETRRFHCRCQALAPLATFQGGSTEGPGAVGNQGCPASPPPDPHLLGP